MPRLRILISAYACEPNRGSEPEVGWQWALHLAQLHDVTVLTRANNRQTIERAFSGRALNGCEPKFLYFDLPDWLKRIKKLGSGGLSIYYFFWQLFARVYFRKSFTEFQIIHHLTFNSFRFPGLWWFTGSSVVLGPLGGGQVTSANYLPLFRDRRLKEQLRSLSVRLSTVNPLFRFSCRQADLIFSANADTDSRLPNRISARKARMLETGICTNQISSPFDRDSGGVVLWVGNLEKWKAGELALRAFAKAYSQNSDLRLKMIGAGPDEIFLRRMAADLQISLAVEFAGRRPMAEVIEEMRRAGMFLFTSVRDTSGNVVLEAMSQRLPVLAIRHHGVIEMCTNETAWLVDPGSIEETATNLSHGILQLTNNKKLSERLTNSAVDALRKKFDWDVKAQKMSEFYQKLLVTPNP